MKNKKVLQILSINKLIHEPVRTAIMSVLIVLDKADFLYLKNFFNLTQGNLSSHIAKLEKAGYITVEKMIVGKRIKTSISINETGKIEFEKYIKTLKSFVRLF